MKGSSLMSSVALHACSRISIILNLFLRSLPEAPNGSAELFLPGFKLFDFNTEERSHTNDWSLVTQDVGSDPLCVMLQGSR